MPAPSAYGGGNARERLGPLALTVVLHIIAVALLIFWKAAPIPKLVEQSLSTVFLPEAKEDGTEPAKAQASKEEKEQESEETAQQAPVQPPAEPEAPTEPPVVRFGPSWMTMSRADFAASDISKMNRAPKASDGAEQGDSSAAYGPGTGPGGVKLYKADWFREPTSAELNGYIPARAPSKGWGIIACQTIARNRVDNCEIVGESPMGSGFARAVREAAWQFLILPPRINGKPQIGTWVSIRIDYGVEKQPG